VSTVGYGDITPTTHRPLFACFFLVAVVLFAYVLAESVALVSDVHRYQRLDAFFAKGITPQILDAMDLFQDGQARSAPLPCIPMHASATPGRHSCSHAWRSAPRA
jgi:hypothetical protein